MTGDRTRLVLVCDYFLPGENAGGPATSIQNLLEVLAGDAEVVVVTRNHDAGCREPYASIEPNCLIDRGLYRIIYATSILRAVVAVSGLSYSTLYTNSLFSPFCTACVVWCLATRPTTRVVTAVRGELGAGALTFSPRRKRLFLGLARASGLFRRVVFHAASAQESADIAGRLKRTSVTVPNVPRLIRTRGDGRVKTPGTLRVLYLSRVHPKKNLLGALSFLSTVRDGHVEFDIFGQIEDEAYYAACERAAQQLPGTVRATFQGSLPRVSVEDVLSRYHVLLLPTLNENFGHVILEAMQAGVLPMISDQTPWEAVASKRIGWCLDVSRNDAWARALVEAVEMGQGEFSSRSDRARMYAHSLYDREELKRAYLHLLTPCN